MTPSKPIEPGAAQPHHDPVAHTLALLRPWIDFLPPRQRRLGLFVFVALLLHLAAFLFIRIDVNHVNFQHQARTHVTVETPRLAAPDAGWDRLADPRLFLLPVLPAPPSFTRGAVLAGDSKLGSGELPAAVSTGLHPLVHASAPTSAEQAAAALVPPRQPFSYAAAPAAPVPADNWQWSETLAQRHPAGLAALPAPVSDTDLRPTRLRVAVEPDGTVGDVLLEDTCQKPELDRQAILAARKARFDRTDQPGLAWGRLTLFWHPTAPPREVVVPTPRTSSP